MALKAIAFDAFGTLVHIGERRSPYRLLMRWAQEHGRARRDGDADLVMSRALDLRGASAALGVTPPSGLLEQWEKDLEHEVASIRLYPDSLDVIIRLQQLGYRVGLCSNLAVPYGARVRELLPMLNAYAMSYDVGAVKPQPRIYQFLLEKLDVVADEVLFVGDTVIADLEGPRAFGMQACLLNRSAGQTLADMVFARLPIGQ
ncbi:HAD family hydrolase [Achromobacter kerstersii]|uniref:HAD family hydrolase n=1 Tax=Achromobacter kerstersii TaxID=1353890 RepID=UPI0006C53627|nr:HAD family hydrolase [Achromobacter kerstersii]CUJ59753.1 (S)-2-haloacid dehalogenase 4A [Achromobacter kerstersii]